MRVLSIGHGTASAEVFMGLISGAGVSQIIDIRSAPGSRHNPQFGRAEMERWLPAAGVAYRLEGALGGFRKTSPASPNTALRHAAFRGYADHMLTQEFASGVDALLRAAGRTMTAVMCSESVWWRCHRRLLSDYLILVHDLEIRHIMHDASVRVHRLTDGVRPVGDHVLYDQLRSPDESDIVASQGASIVPMPASTPMEKLLNMTERP
jgi:uncharacterized protein (DUF488 family)